MRNPVHFLRIVGLCEAISFLLLLGIAMPLKYIWHMPIAVKIAGSIHGILFITFCIALARAKSYSKWSIGRAAIIFIAALLPFGPFVIDRRIKQWENSDPNAPR
jgi:integral membrane protein